MRLLDLFCGAGGCAEGYRRAGFTDIVGVDLHPQPRYPFDFVRADAVMFLRCLIEADAIGDANATGGLWLSDFDAVHASPPCQVHSAARRIGNAKPGHKDYLPQTRHALTECGKPWVIENVPGAPLVNPTVLCGTQFGLRLRRHRLFESNVPLIPLAAPCRHATGDMTVFGHAVQECGTRGPSYLDAAGRTHYRPLRRPLEAGRAAMGINWMNRTELSQAIPPDYTEFIGRQLIACILARREGVAA